MGVWWGWWPGLLHLKQTFQLSTSNVCVSKVEGLHQHVQVPVLSAATSFPPSNKSCIKAGSGRANMSFKKPLWLLFFPHFHLLFLYLSLERFTDSLDKQEGRARGGCFCSSQERVLTPSLPSQPCALLQGCVGWTGFTEESQRRWTVSVCCPYHQAPGPHQSHQASRKTNKSWLHLPAVWRQQPVRSTAQECAHKRSISLGHDSKTARQPHAACDFPKASAQIPTSLCHTLSQDRITVATCKRHFQALKINHIFLNIVYGNCGERSCPSVLGQLARRTGPQSQTLRKDRPRLWWSCYSASQRDVQAPSVE